MHLDGVMRRVLALIVIILLMVPLNNVEELPEESIFRWSEVECVNGPGNSSIDRVGCLDSDGDGFSDPDNNWTLESQADACPFTYGISSKVLSGCPDMDRDWYADIIDPDIDGDGITNEFELLASNLIIRYNPYDKDSFPPDSDFDLVPDVIDDDDDNDGWPDLIEVDRGSDEFDPQSTPFTLYFGSSTGFFYEGGFSITDEYTTEGTEVSISGLIEIITEELIIPILLIPLYFALFAKRKKHFKSFIREIDAVESFTELRNIETRANQCMEDKKFKLYHALILRNRIEQKESEMGGEKFVAIDQEIDLHEEE